MGMKRKDHHRHTAIIIARTTLHNYEFLISSTIGYRHLYISQYQHPALLSTYLPLCACAVARVGCEEEEGTGRISAFTSWPYRTAYANANPCTVRQPFRPVNQALGSTQYLKRDLFMMRAKQEVH